MDYHRLHYALCQADLKLKKNLSEQKQRCSNALLFALQDQSQDAEQIVESALKDFPDNAVLWIYLARIQAYNHKLEESMISYLESIKLCPSNVVAYYGLALIIRQMPEIKSVLIGKSAKVSAEAFESLSSELDPANSSLPSGMIQQIVSGCLFIVEGRNLDAVNVFKRLNHLFADHADILSLLAGSLGLAKDRLASLLVKAHLMYLLNDFKKASRYFACVWQGICKDEISTFRYLDSLFNMHEFDQVISIGSNALSTFSSSRRIHQVYINCLFEAWEPDKARKAIADARAVLLDPDFCDHDYYLALPPIYNTQDEINLAKNKFSSGLSALISKYTSYNNSDLVSISESVRYNFDLSYQGLPSVDLHSRYGNFASNVISKTLKRSPSNLLSCKRSRIRVGYVIHKKFLIDGLFLGWIEGHNPTLFEVYVFLISDDQRLYPVQQLYKKAAEHFFIIRYDFESVYESIREANLDILTYLYIGLSPFVFRLASLKLAPIQCAAWGHPDTTGLPSIDYFISNSAMEPADAKSHYSEKLIQLPRVGVNLTPTYIPPKNKNLKSEFCLPIDKLIFISPQSYGKHLPSHCNLYAEILSQVPSSICLFVGSPTPYVSNVFKKRLADECSKVGVDFFSQIVFLPSQPYWQYLQLLSQADIFLDSLDWSGGLTAIDAVSIGLPIITVPGRLFRGRQSYGLLSTMGVNDTICCDATEYVSKAVYFGSESDARDALKDSIISSHSNLFFDNQAILYLEEFYACLRG